MDRIRLDVYGRFDLVIERSEESVSVYRSTADGKRAPVRHLLIPHDAEIDEIVDLVDIAFHELAGPTDQVRVRLQVV